MRVALIALWIPVLLVQGCALSFEDRLGQINRVGFFWEKSAAPAGEEVELKKIRTLGLGVDTTELTGGIVVGFKEWTVLSLGAESEVTVCVPEDGFP